MCPGCDSKQSDGESPEMGKSTHSLVLLPSRLWPGVVALDKILSIGQIELICILTLNWIVWNRTVFKLCANKKTVLMLNSMDVVRKRISDKSWTKFLVFNKWGYESSHTNNRGDWVL